MAAPGVEQPKEVSDKVEKLLSKLDEKLTQLAVGQQEIATRLTILETKSASAASGSSGAPDAGARGGISRPLKSFF